MKISKILVCISIIACSLATFNPVKAQSGDQILDGIGETALSARYLFGGDTKDWSRNHFNANGNQITFANDDRFGNVLSLSGDDRSFITIPVQAVANLESFSFTSWIYLKSDKAGQHYFDLGTNETNHLFAAPSGTLLKPGFQVMMASKLNEDSGATSKPVETNKWIHLAIVVDVSSKSITTFINGRPVARGKYSPEALAQIVSGKPDEKKFFIGKSISKGKPNLNANIHDFRIYRVALNEKQVAAISGNLSNNQINTTAKPVEDLPQFSSATPQLYNQYLISVEDISINTTVGNLPRLPGHVKGYYRSGITGPDVRVLWPSPTNIIAVSKPGTFTVTGNIPGTNFKPKVKVTVIESSSEIKPQLKLKSFPLNQVILTNDENGRKTKFIENQDKFLNVLAQTDPNSFLYMFRHAYGQKQPEGAKPLGGWDTEDTKLRGHATGHYLSAIAQAYKSTSYNKPLQANFERKITYMVNTLYDLSQLSGKPAKGSKVHQSNPKAVPMGPGKKAFDSDLSTEGIRNDYWNWGEGFISAYPPDQFIMLESGAKYGGQKNQIWAPYYTLHKILAGLIDVYEVTGNKKALTVAEGMNDWVYARLSKLP
ncbi:MAG: hypothetical protein EOP55_17105, partial [Sphingobacteriales bacterium]